MLMAAHPTVLLFASLFSGLADWSSLLTNPLFLALSLFQLWMLIDAIRREEWMWVLFIFLFPFINAILYFFLVYRAVPSATRGFELPGAHDRRRIKELQAQIHHLDKPHHHSQLGDIYFQQGKEKVCAEKPKHDYGHSMMALAETQAVLGDPDAAIATWQRVLEDHSYARARVQLAELFLQKTRTDLAKTELNEVLADDRHAPAFQRKRERVWVRKAKALLRKIG